MGKLMEVSQEMFGRLAEDLSSISRRLEDMHAKQIAYERDMLTRLVRLETLIEQSGQQARRFQLELDEHRRDVTRVSVGIATIGAAVSAVLPFLRRLLD